MEIRYEDITIKVIDMEIGIHEQVIKASDGHYTIFLNARDAVDQRMLAYEHAIQHLRNEDFEKDDVQKIETDAHLIENQAHAPAPEKPKKKRRDSDAAFERQWSRLQKKLARKRKDLVAWGGNTEF